MADLHVLEDDIAAGPEAWLADELLELESHLDRHRRFDDYYDARERGDA